MLGDNQSSQIRSNFPSVPLLEQEEKLPGLKPKKLDRIIFKSRVYMITLVILNGKKNNWLNPFQISVVLTMKYDGV